MDVIRTNAEQGLLELGGRAEIEVPKWLKDSQVQALETFKTLGLPTRRVEAWKYTDLRSVLKQVLPAAEKSTITSSALNEALGADFAGISADRLVIVNGRFDASLSSTEIGERVDVLALSDALDKGPGWFDAFNKVRQSDLDGVQALNLSMMQGGVCLNVNEGVVLNRPIHLIFASQGDAARTQTSRCYINIGSGAEVKVIETHVQIGAHAVHTNLYTEILLGNYARLDHVKFAHDNDDCVHLANVATRLQSRSDYRLFQMTVDGGVTRNQIEVQYEGREARADISGTALLAGSSHCDMTLVMNHVGVSCASRELFKAVLDARSRAVFQGKVIVQPGAQKTDGEMMSKALLLSDDAEFDSKPELEIYADDVLCGHGATTGQLDDELMFYLLARGVPAPDARGLLIQAFIGEALELVEDDDIRRVLVGRAFERHRIRGAIDNC